MKECKILHINDGKPREIVNGDWKFVEEYDWMEDILHEYLDQGFEVKHMASSYVPAQMSSGIAFYISGVTVYLEREVEKRESRRLMEEELVEDELLEDFPEE